MKKKLIPSLSSFYVHSILKTESLYGKQSPLNRHMSDKHKKNNKDIKVSLQHSKIHYCKSFIHSSDINGTCPQVNKISDADQLNENYFSFLANIRTTFIYSHMKADFLSQQPIVDSASLCGTAQTVSYSTRQILFLHRLLFQFLLWPISLSALHIFFAILAKLWLSEIWEGLSFSLPPLQILSYTLRISS